MKLTTKKDLIVNVAKHWFNQYPRDKDGIGERLIYEKPTTEEEVEAIIGNRSWTRLECDECGQEVDSVVSLGVLREQESAICPSCLSKAIQLLNP